MDKQFLEIRHATADDIPALTMLYHHLNPVDEPVTQDHGAQLLHQLHQYRGSRVLLGFHGAKPVSTCTLIVIPNLTKGGIPYALIENVVTHADHRNMGFGKQMLASAVDQAWSEGCYKVMLLTGSAEPSTLSFYQSAGFSQNKTGFQIRNMPVRGQS